MERINNLRLRTFENDILGNEFYYLFYKKYAVLSEMSEYKRYSEAFYSAFANLTPSINDGELIVGCRNTHLSPEQELEWQEKYKDIANTHRCMVGQDSHMSIDYDLLLNYGIDGIIDKIDQYISICDTNKISFYNACKHCLKAILKHSENYSATALELSRQTDEPKRKAELQKISEICRKVPAQPAESFYEAIQSVHFVTHCISLNPYRLSPQQFQLGHPDRYLLEFYENDIKNGVITKDFAQLLLDCLGIQINMRVPNGLSSGYMVGGRDENGNIVANDLTEMCMQVIDDIQLVYPAVGLCYTEGMDEKYLDKACELLSKGHSHPAIFNDDTISKGLQYYGVDEAQSHNYIHSTCVEITPVATSNVWVASPYVNMPYFLLNSLDKEYPNLNALIDEILAKLEWHINECFLTQNAYRKKRAENSINPLLSCFVNDCLERGLDIERGGARYNWVMPSFVGMANLIDSLYAINQLVFIEKKMSFSEFKTVLDNNFEGNEALRQYIINRIPKYGNDIDEVDIYFSIFTEHIIRECEKYSGMYTNGNLIPSAFCWIMHEWFGRETGATPDGRLKGFPLGDGSGPCQGREKNGPTASVLSSTKWEHHKLIGGIAVNLKFSKSSLGANSIDSIKAIVKTYLARGGFELQINTVDNDTLKKARISPEEYQDLVVRIGGYSDYFIKLSPNMQDELILRTEHHV